MKQKHGPAQNVHVELQNIDNTQESTQSPSEPIVEPSQNNQVSICWRNIELDGRVGLAQLRGLAILALRGGPNISLNVLGEDFIVFWRV